MEQFSLEKYLENPSRKVVTRDGREVEILKTDFRGYKQIIGVIKNRDNKDDEVARWDGQGYFKSLFGESKYDLFFVDEGEKLTEFEKAIYQYICSIVTACDGEVFGDKELKPIVKGIAKELLDLARKELEKDIEHSSVEFAKSYMEDVNPSFEKVQESEELWKWKMSCLRGINKAYTQGKQEALKDLPKWKKVDSNPPKVQYNLQGKRLYKDGEYYIELSDLETLPKEE